ncbi:MAG: hypothetical protein Q7R31_02540 [Candidatus Levybacteria bacterium]|nr:hypothetical protein [Candidatus Levybacteria bacterium]
MSNIKLSSIGYLIVIIGLFLYSFTQVDLSLTLSRWSVWQIIQKYFQHIGYFQRPLSAFLYVAVILLLYIFYFLFLSKAYSNKISKRQVWFLIISVSIILAFSYNAFSYDLFNYIFDAKIITYYQQNPYIHKALDYPGDPMLSFMHWTHRAYPYGPIWLLLTVPLSFLGFKIFLLTFFLFKFLMAISFIGTVFFIGKILKKISPQYELFGIVFFALNPLVIIESLVSAHNDIVMMFFAILSIYLFMNNKYARSLLLLILSIGVKFASAILIPIFIASYFFRKYSWEKITLLITIGMITTIVVASIRTNFQPWYLLYALPFAALLARKYFILIPSLVITFFSLLQYAPFIYLGNWNPPVPMILSYLTNSSILLSLLIVIVWFSKRLLVRKV